MREFSRTEELYFEKVGKINSVEAWEIHDKDPGAHKRMLSRHKAKKKRKK